MSESARNRPSPSEATLKKLRDYRHTEETRAQMSEAHKGKIFSEEHRKNMSLNHVGTAGKKLPGRILSEEHKRKIAESWVRRRARGVSNG